jgi:hypothetical protein
LARERTTPHRQTSRIPAFSPDQPKSFPPLALTDFRTRPLLQRLRRHGQAGPVSPASSRRWPVRSRPRAPFSATGSVMARTEETLFGRRTSHRNMHAGHCQTHSRKPRWAIPSTSHAAATAVPTAPPANTAPEILTRPVSGKPRHSARRGGEVDPSERQQLRATRSHSTA